MKNLKQLAVTVIIISLTACSHLPGCAVGGTPGGKAAFVKPVSFSLLQDYPKGEEMSEVVQDFQLMKELGITVWRGSFSWMDYEPERGKYDFAWLHRFVGFAAQQGITLRPYLDYTPAWAAKGGTDREVWNDPPRRLDDWRDFVSRTVRELKPYSNIVSYEIYNEENTKPWWDGSAAEYNQVLRTAADAVKAASPTTQVILGGMVYPDFNWVEQACVTNGNARKFDVVPFHAYPETWTPPNITVENYLDQGRPGYFEGKFVPLVDEKCAHQPIWMNEVGFATAPGKSELDQANWWARAIATFLADPRVEHLGIYQVRDRRQQTKIIGESENYYLGLTRADRTKKLAFHTVKRLVGLLDTGRLTVADAELAVEVTGGRKGELFHHLFVRPDGRQVLLVWDKKGNPTLRLKTRKGSAAVEYALDGAAQKFESFDGEWLSDLRLTPGTVRIFGIR
jgi:polysaccharide biosynthesis protein PslG